VVQLVWGRSVVPYGLPEQLQGPLFSVYGTQFPSRAFMMLVALLMLVSSGCC
jgi:branched-chain amino acid transport system permease protein